MKVLNGYNWWGLRGQDTLSYRGKALSTHPDKNLWQK
jgi:hypothetical protein